MEETKQNKAQNLVAYQVSNGKDGQAYFNRIGAAFPHRDGNGFDVVLNSIPVDGRVTVRTVQERLDDLREGKAAAQQGRDQEHER